MVGYLSLPDLYRIMHRLATAHYSIHEIEEMHPYERDVYLALVYKDIMDQKKEMDAHK